jgi:predicted RNA methylase
MRRARILGQYFTPAPVVELCYRMLGVLDPDARNPSIMDPACGDGAFLRYALEHGITNRVCGIEKDPHLAASWEAQGLSVRADLTIGDGLLPFNPQSEIRNPKSFDWVVGNPPFGTRCLGEEADLEALARDYTIWRESRIRHRMLATYPIEILFLERFVRLAKPGGYVAIIVPDGILANARLSYVRDWLAAHAEVKAVVSLPQHVFSRTGASSKGSVLLLRRTARGDDGGMGVWEDGSAGDRSLITHHSSPIFLAALESRVPIRTGVPKMAKLFSDFVHSNSELRTPNSALDCPPWLAYTVEGLFSGERLDPAYHHPRYVENTRFLQSLPNVVTLGELTEYTTYGQVGRRDLADSGVRLITPANFVMTEDGYTSGLDIHSPERFTAPGSRNDPPRSRLRKGDLLLVNSGVGCIGRAAVFYGDQPCNISQHVNLIRVRGIEPEYLAIYLQTSYARLQIAREKCGVGACGINFDRIKSILTPVLQEDVRHDIARRYSASCQRARHGIAEIVTELEELISASEKH